MNDPQNELLPEPATSTIDAKQTSIGSVFVSNYPPYFFWKAEYLDSAMRALHSRPLPEAWLGLYVHVPFCRKRCKFCYFRVYTEKNNQEVQAYLDALSKEVALYSRFPAVTGRRLKFVYFGGGTPSFLSARDLRALARDLKRSIPWNGTEEITFECEPGTLTKAKLEAIQEIGVTRLSLGIENFNDWILEENGRAHHSKEISRVMPWIREMQFEQLNVDLIAGMVGESWETWRDSVQKTIDLDADSVTIYQMELPFNTVFSDELGRGALRIPLADWETKRDWHNYAFEQLAAAGYKVSSAYTMVKKEKDSHFVYRDSVWRGSDMIGAGVASFSHMNGVHFQNVAGWNEYLEMLDSHKLPLQRAFPASGKERLTREMILQFKLGEIDAAYFQEKFSTNIVEEFSSAFQRLASQGYLTIRGGRIRLTQKGLLRVDQLLPEFYATEYRNARYT